MSKYINTLVTIKDMPGIYKLISCSWVGHAHQIVVDRDGTRLVLNRNISSLKPVNKHSDIIDEILGEL